MEDASRLDRFEGASRQHWLAVEREAGSRQALRDELQAAGYRVSVATVGSWCRGQYEPPFAVYRWSSERYGVSLHEGPIDEGLDASVRDQLDEMDRRIRELTSVVGALQGWAIELAARAGTEIHFPLRIDQSEPPADLRAEMAALRRDLDQLRRGA